MSKRYVQCKTVEECIAGHNAGVLWWNTGTPHWEWHVYWPKEWYNMPRTVWETQLKDWYPSVLVDDEE